MKKLLVVVLTLSLLFVISGCSDNSTASVIQTSTPTTTPVVQDRSIEDDTVYISKDGMWKYVRLTTLTIEIRGYSGSDANLTIPDKIDGYSVTSIGDSAFDWRASMSTITIPNSVTHLEDNPFSDCAYLTSINVASDHPVLASIDGVLFNKTEKKLICYPRGIKSKVYVIPQGIRIIGDYAFNDCFTLTSITIPDSVTTIGKCAFSSCNVTTFTLPNSVTSIGDYAFEWCNELEKINIPDSVTHLGANPFRNTDVSISISDTHPVFEKVKGVLFDKRDRKLIHYPASSYILYGEEKYAIPEGTNSIGDSAFYGCDALVSITIPDSVSYIGDHAFNGCSRLGYITIPYGVTSIGKYTFSGCGELTWVSIPDTVTSIGDSAFSSCTDLTSITISNSVTSIGNNAFYRCKSLTSITIPDSVTSVGNNPFACCSKLTKIIVSPNHPVLETIDGVLFDKIEKRLICFPHSNKSISYVIPQGTKIIGASAFSTCQSLTTVTIPDSVTTIMGFAFGDCTSLASLTIPSSVSFIGDTTFSNTGALKTISVTAGSYAEQYCKRMNRNYTYSDANDWLTN